MIYLGFLLHLYQPPQQVPEVLRKIGEECYRPLLRLVNGRPDARFTLNLNWSLTERWLLEGYADLVDAVRHALDTDRVEVTSSAAYHAIVPLIPEGERSRQVLLNDERSRQVYGKSYRPVGFFPPEMAFGPEVVDTIAPLGYRWTIADDTSYTAVHGEAPGRWIATASNFPVLLRSGMWSNRIAMERGPDGKPFGGAEIARWLVRDLTSWFGTDDGYLILAMDGETFGHHLKGAIESFLIPFLDTLATMRRQVRLVHLGELLEHFPKRETGVPPGSWSTSREEFLRGNFYPLWKGQGNEAHALLWELTRIAHTGIDRMHQMLDQSLNSCTFWWVAQRPAEVSPMTTRGIDMLMRVIELGNTTAVDRAMAIYEQLQALLASQPQPAEAASEPLPETAAESAEPVRSPAP